MRISKISNDSVIGPLRRSLRAFQVAFTFLTVIPLPTTGQEASEEALRDARLAFPVVGFVLGVLFYVLSTLATRYGVSSSLSAFLLLAGGVAVSGGLHLDGLGDTGDGLFLWGDPPRRLAVMRDPHLGSYGVAAIVLVLLGKFAALTTLSGRARGIALLTSLTISRTLILVAAGSAAYARPEGTGRHVVSAATPHEAFAAALIILLFATLFNGLPGLAAGVVALALTWLLTRLARTRLGGVTGDILGALVELGEMIVLVVLGCLAGAR